jgi:hypothetical protein
VRYLALMIVSAVLAGAVAASSAAEATLKVTPNPVRAGHAVSLAGSADACPVGGTVTVLSRQ